MGLGIGGFLEQLLAPPGGPLLMALLGLVLLRRRDAGRRAGRWLLAIGLGLAYVSALPVTAGLLMAALEPEPLSLPTPMTETRAQAVVVLGGGRRHYAPEYHATVGAVGAKRGTVNHWTLERLRYAAWLARRTGLPVLVSGGLAEVDLAPEAWLMRDTLTHEFSQPVRWVEADSRNTWENARLSAELLKRDGIQRILLVTHAAHMPRARWSFEQFGLEVMPAPTAFEHWPAWKLRFRDFLPSARAQFEVADAFHEVVGLLWYRLRY